MATRSVRLTQGFHASANDEFHAHTGNYINILENEEWDFEEEKKNFKNVNNTKNTLKAIENNIIIYPNPTTGIFTVELKSEITKVEITDITGKNINSKNNILSNKIVFDISEYKQGIYIVKSIQNNQINIQKIIKL